MGLLIFAIVVLVVAWLFYYAVGEIGLQPPFLGLLRFLILALAAVAILLRAGLLT